MDYVKGVEEKVVEQMLRSVLPSVGPLIPFRDLGAQGPVGPVGEKIMGIEEKTGKRKGYRNVCQETGRGRGVVREYGISRLKYRAKSDTGMLEGVRRASW